MKQKLIIWITKLYVKIIRMLGHSVNEFEQEEVEEVEEEKQEGYFEVDKTLAPCPNCGNPAHLKQEYPNEVKYICGSTAIMSTEGIEKFFASNECLFFGDRIFDITRGYMN